MSQADTSGKIAIAWTNLNYSTSGITKSNKLILNGVNGLLRFGSLTGLMGPSGAGKTSLLKVLSGTIKTGLSDQSRIYISGEMKNRCLIGQHETNHLIMELTVRQNMIYASKLKNSLVKKDNEFNHVSHVKSILDELNISHIEKTRVGDCSGGQQKRLILALELTAIQKPNVLFIDEPTTGLDSEAALTIMKSLVALSKDHRIAIMTSTHQPNREMLDMLDSLYVLAIGGRCVYSGCPQDISPQLNGLGIEQLPNQTPIECLMKISSENVESNIQTLVKQTLESQKNSINESELQSLNKMKQGKGVSSKSFSFIDLWSLLMRSMLHSYISRWKTQVIQTVFYAMTGLLIALMFNPIIGKIDKCFDHLSNPNTTCAELLDEDSRLLQNIKFIFFNSVIIMFIPICVTAITFPSNLNVFAREHRNGWYSTSCYFIAVNITEALPTAINAVLFSVITFSVSGQSMEMSRLFGYTLLLTIGMLSSQALGFLIGVLFVKHQALAVLLAVGSYSVLTNLSNLMILTKDLPFVFQYFSRFSITKLISNSVIIVIYGRNNCTNGTQYVLNKYDLQEDMLTTDFLITISYFLSLTLLAHLLLLIKTNNVLQIIFTRRQKHSSSFNLSFSSEEIKIFEEPGTVGVGLQCNLIQELKNKLQSKKESIKKTGLPMKDNSDRKATEKRLCIAWTDLTLVRPKSLFQNEIRILNNLSGCLEFGSMTALLGPSGAGKTSLLKTINGRQTLKLNEECKLFTNNYRKMKTCFISQEVSEHIVIGLTVEQIMTYASKLKNRHNLFDHRKNIRKLMEELMIISCAQTRVENCSGGEQKRLVIAMELTAKVKPNFICIDEPTSGLDSNAAEVVIGCLKRVVDKHNVCVITSIHQPNVRVVTMFDNLYALSKGGHLAYAGPPDRLALHLAECGVQCSQSDSPIEILIKYSCNDANDSTLSKLLNKTNVGSDQIEKHCSDDTTVSHNGIKFLSKRFFINDLFILMSRSIRQLHQYLWRYMLFKSMALLFFGFSLTLLFSPDMAKPSGCLSLDEDIGKCFKSEKLKGEALLTQNLYFNFMAPLLFLVIELVSTTITFTDEVKIFFNEHRNSWYSTAVYYWSKALLELIPSLITIVGYILIIAKFNGYQYFWDYFLVLSLGVLCIQNIGHIIGILFSNDLKSGLISSMVYYIVICLFSNYLVPISELHYSLRYLSDLSVIKLMVESLVIRFYGFDRCRKGEISSVLYFYKLNNGLYYRNQVLLFVQMIVLRILVLFCMLAKNNVKQKRQTKYKVTQDEQNTKLNLYF